MVGYANFLNDTTSDKHVEKLHQSIKKVSILYSRSKNQNNYIYAANKTSAYMFDWK